LDTPNLAPEQRKRCQGLIFVCPAVNGRWRPDTAVRPNTPPSSAGLRRARGWRPQPLPTTVLIANDDANAKTLLAVRTRRRALRSSRLCLVGRRAPFVCSRRPPRSLQLPPRNRFQPKVGVLKGSNAGRPRYAERQHRIQLPPALLPGNKVVTGITVDGFVQTRRLARLKGNLRLAIGVTSGARESSVGSLSARSASDRVPPARNRVAADPDSQTMTAGLTTQVCM
jgi:hypothetical protein